MIVGDALFVAVGHLRILLGKHSTSPVLSGTESEQVIQPVRRRDLREQGVLSAIPRSEFDSKRDPESTIAAESKISRRAALRQQARLSSALDNHATPESPAPSEGHAAPEGSASPEGLSVPSAPHVAEESLPDFRSDNVATRVLGASELVEAVTDGLAQARGETCEANLRATIKSGSRKPRVSLRRSEYFRRGLVVSTMALIGVAIPVIGSDSFGLPAQASQPLTASLVGGVVAQSDTPAALAGSSTAAIKSATKDMKQVQGQPSTSNACLVDSAQGLRAAFTSEDVMVYPVAASAYRMTSYFGYRSNPFGGGGSFHAGDDFAAPRNTPIYAIAEGTVTYTGKGIEGRSNNLIIVEHNIDGHIYESWYIHMYDDGILVKAGDKVTAGQVIGKVGSNGNSTGPHVHLEIHDPALANESDDKQELLDPLEFLAAHNAQDIAQLCN